MFSKKNRNQTFLLIKKLYAIKNLATFIYMLEKHNNILIYKTLKSLMIRMQLAPFLTTIYAETI